MTLSDLPRDSAQSAGDWLESQNLVRIARSVARKYHLSDSDLEDLVQDTSVVITKIDRRIPLNASLVFRVAECRAKDLLRRADRVTIREREIPRGVPVERSPELSLLLAARIAALPDGVRRVIELKLAGYSEREIALLLDLGRKVVRSRFAWALRLLGRSPQE